MTLCTGRFSVCTFTIRAHKYDSLLISRELKYKINKNIKLIKSLCRILLALNISFFYCRIKIDVLQKNEKRVANSKNLLYSC